MFLNSQPVDYTKLDLVLVSSYKQIMISLNRPDPDPRFKNRIRISQHFLNEFRWNMLLSYIDSWVKVPAELDSTL